MVFLHYVVKSWIPIGFLWFYNSTAALPIPSLLCQLGLDFLPGILKTLDFLDSPSVFWILLLTNIMNFLDGVSGLTSGVSSVGFFILFILSLDTNLHLVDQSLLTSLSLIASIISFVGFVLELPLLNPKVLLGDAGSMPMGFLLASLSMINGGKLATLGIVLLVPLFDGVFVILYRLYKGRSPLIGDQNHLHHKLLDKGFSRLQIISLYFVVTLVFGLMAIFAWNTYLKLLTFVFAAIVLTVFFYLTWNVNGYQRRN